MKCGQRTQMPNIALIGMPGCGKTTIGSMLADRLGRGFHDTDEWICRNTGKSIPDIFALDGESHFRELETEALKLQRKGAGVVIATGGGCVTQPRNYWILKQNSIILWLQRDLEKLPLYGRPLSQANNLTDLFSQRKALYEQFSDAVIDNNASPEETVASILRYLDKII